jgi:DNA-binding NarL/FixJ family response regulator
VTETPKKLRIVLADDHAEVLERVRELLSPDFEIAGSACNGLALVEMTAALRPDAVVCDLNIPGLNGLDAGRLIQSRGLCDTVVLLTMYNEPQLIRRALAAGIRGYVIKVDAGEELTAALYTVLNGERYLSREALLGWENDGGEDESSSGR